MNAKEKLVAVVSPWEKLSDLIKSQFRMESLPAEKNVMIWRDDLQTEKQLTAELTKAGVKPIELRKKKPTEWKGVD